MSPLGRRDALDELLEHLFHAFAGLAGDDLDLVAVDPEQLAHFVAHALGLGAREVDLVEARDQLEPGVDREVGVGDGLRLDPLRGVDDEQRAFTGLQRAARPRR